MDVFEIKRKKRSGDLITAAVKVSITPANAQAALLRPDSKYHKQVCEALELIILSREQLIEA